MSFFSRAGSDREFL